MAFTVENLSSVQLLGNLALSPDGSKVIYRVTPSFKTGKCPGSGRDSRGVRIYIIL